MDTPSGLRLEIPPNMGYRTILVSGILSGRHDPCHHGRAVSQKPDCPALMIFFSLRLRCSQLRLPTLALRLWRRASQSIASGSILPPTPSSGQRCTTRCMMPGCVIEVSEAPPAQCHDRLPCRAGAPAITTQFSLGTAWRRKNPRLLRNNLRARCGCAWIAAGAFT